MENLRSSWEFAGMADPNFSAQTRGRPYGVGKDPGGYACARLGDIVRSEPTEMTSVIPVP